MRIGSLFSGAGGLDLAVQAVFGGAVVWHAEIDKAASKVLAHRWPGVPNLGDITGVDWADVPPVDILCGGFPCQDVSAAGKRAGIKHGTRSGLWSVMADAIEALQPQIVVVENVRGLLSAAAHRMEPDETTLGNGSNGPVLRAAGAVLGDLADLGYDAQWATVAAADVGAPHRRERVFIVAADADSQRRVSQEFARGMDEAQSRTNRDRSPLSTDAAHPSRNGWDEGRPESAGIVGGFDAAVSGDEPGVALLPTPTQSDGTGGGIRTGLSWEGTTKSTGDGGNSRLRDVAGLLGPLLPTPTTQDGANNGGPSQFQRNTLPLNAEVTLLPTPQAFDQVDYVRTPEQLADQAQRPNGGGARNLREVVVNELPEPTLLSTPQARDYKGVPADNFNTANLCRDVANTAQWGKYEPAIRRWEQVTRPAPAPTEPNKNGNPRLSAAFSEWMMGWPAGWVTDPAIGISRNDQLRIVGNGVCPQQAAYALRILLEAAGA